MDAARQSIHAVVAALARGEIISVAPRSLSAPAVTQDQCHLHPLELGLWREHSGLALELEPVLKFLHVQTESDRGGNCDRA